MFAYDLVFGAEGETLSYHPEQETPIEAGAQPVRAGWIGGDGPGIDPQTWPRSPINGLPMVHIITLRLPADYQRRGPEFPAISFFAGEGQFAADDDEVEPDAGSDDPFLVQLADAEPHPQFRLLTDIIDGHWGLLWLTEDEFARRTPVPADVRVGDEHTSDDDEGVNAWDDAFDEVTVWLAARDDPNAGVAPTEDDDTAYDGNWYTDDDSPLARANGRCHLGGTTFCVQAVPEGLTPYYLELEEFGPLNFGAGGNAQIDLESDTFDWACG